MADELVLEPKKSKKSKKTLDLDAATEGVADLDLADKPKKKKKKDKKEKNDEDDNADLDLDLPKKEKKEKKKKKEKKEGEGEGDASAQPTLDLGKKKKKKEGKDKEGKSGKKDKKSGNSKHYDRFANQDDVEKQEIADYGYEPLLDRVFKLMAQKGLGTALAEGEERKFTVKPPKMSRMGTKRTVYENFGETCKDLKRDPKHVMNYILTEVGATGNFTEKQTLIIKGKYTSAMMEKILRPYIREYVLCKTCLSPNTKLTKMDRLTFLECNDCSSKSAVQQTKRGFEAITGKRKRIKDQQGGAATLNAVSNK